ncbi:MAG: hypothetical protein H6536_09105 [Bacteroidales bacterium]|nr:hypothetical protein [Bacteroidales bacterium]
MKTIYYIVIIALGLSMLACERDNFSNDSSLKLSFSADTVLFDTVFTTIGSATRYLKVYNNSKSDVRIASIGLAGGSTSPYRINVDGMSGSSVTDIPLRSRDSLFIFVEVTVDPTSQNSPLLIADSIVFQTNGNIQDVKLVSWGQDVHLLKSETIAANTTLPADKPYLIYDYLFVDTLVTLTLEAGAKLHFHNNAQLIVAGTITAQGTHDMPIVFEGDRLEDFYNDKAGQWAGLWLYAGSQNNRMDWVEVRNSIYGIVVDSCVTPPTPTLELSHSKIENTSYIGLLARGAIIIADNCLFANSAQVTVALTMGGTYQFYHCTVANYWGDYMFRKGPALLLNNYYYSTESVIIPRHLHEASFYNSIVYGSINSEITIDNKVNGQPVNAEMNYYFQDCILKVPSDFALTDESKFKNVLRIDPKFKDPSKYIYLLDTLSPAKDIANIEIAIKYLLDLNNFNRLTDTKPDLGAFERDE